MLGRLGVNGRLCIGVLLLIAAPASAEPVGGSVRISFTASSTLHDFTGTAGSPAVSVAQDASRSWSGEVSVPVAQMNTGNGWRDGDMREMLDAANHPRIRGRFRELDPERVRSSGLLPFSLQIRSVERPLQALVRNWRQSEREASFDAAFDLSLQSFGLEAPQSFFLSVDDIVHVLVHVTLERAG
jgi:hypothetical protein